MNTIHTRVFRAKTNENARDGRNKSSDRPKKFMNNEMYELKMLMVWMSFARGHSANFSVKFSWWFE